jgi:hypothetical protein
MFASAMAITLPRSWSLVGKSDEAAAVVVVVADPS